MWRLIPLLLLAGCISRPAPLTQAQVHAMDAVTLCTTAGRAFALNDANGFHLVMTEVGVRHEGPSPAECAALAQMGANSVAVDAERRQAMAAAWANGMAEMQKAYAPKPAVSCTSIGNTTNCQTH